MKIKVNGIRYFVDIHNRDNSLPNLILLHGFMGSGRAFSSLISYFTEFCNPVTVDLLGHGKTEGAASADRFEVSQQIADLHQIITTISDHPPYLHGYSMGGRLAVRYALAHPKSLQGLILESTNYGLEEETKIQQRQQTDEKRAQSIETDFQLFLEEWKLLPVFRSDISLSQRKLNFYYRIQAQQDARQMARSLRGFGSAQMASVKNRLHELTLPVLFLAGQTDIKYAQIGRQMHKILPQSELSIISDAGHRVHFEHPKAFVSTVKSFLENQ